MILLGKKMQKDAQNRWMLSAPNAKASKRLSLSSQRENPK